MAITTLAASQDAMQSAMLGDEMKWNETWCNQLNNNIIKQMGKVAARCSNVRDMTFVRKYWCRLGMMLCRLGLSSVMVQKCFVSWLQRYLWCARIRGKNAFFPENCGCSGL